MLNLMTTKKQQYVKNVEQQFMGRFLVYLCRWVFSGLIMSIPLYGIRLLGFMNPYINLIIVSIIGAIVFWQIDKLIFKPRGIEEIKQLLKEYKNNEYNISESYKKGVISALQFALRVLK